jgi:hypothetical protein
MGLAATPIVASTGPSAFIRLIRVICVICGKMLYRHR